MKTSFRLQDAHAGRLVRLLALFTVSTMLHAGTAQRAEGLAEADPVLGNPAWTADGGEPGALFGLSAATAGDVNGDGFSDVIVGAPGYDGGQPYEGRAFVFLGNPSGLASTPAWTVESNQSGAEFGTSVATAGDVNGDGYADVIVGAPSYTNGQEEEGAAFVYLGSATGLSTTPAWTTEGNQAGAAYGLSVDTAGDVNGDGRSDVIVGAYSYSSGQSDEGRAFVYLGTASGVAFSPAWTAEPNQADAHFGYSVSTAGDVNGDGYDEVIVGAHRYDNGQDEEGRAFLYLGGAGGLGASPSWTGESNSVGAHFGASVANAGDVNGDGFADVLVGAPQLADGLALEGAAFAYLGSGSGLSASPAWIVESDRAAAYFGDCVATAGDLNGDGFADVCIGGPGYTNGQSGEGRASVFLGSMYGLDGAAAWNVESDQVGASLGSAVATAGDANGDGFGDLLVGSYAFDAPDPDEGRAFVYLGSAGGPAPFPQWRNEVDQAVAAYGIAVAPAGDVNGDGYSDVLVGAHDYDGGQSDEGRTFLYLGGPSGLLPTAAWTAEGDQAVAHFGLAVAGAGDIDGDGFADVLVGAPGFDGGQTDEGRAYLFRGSASGLMPAPAATLECDQAGAAFGTSVAGAGDVNADGYADVIVGAPYYDGGQTNEGRVFIYLGAPTGLGPVAWTTEPDQGNALFGISVASAGDVNGDTISDVVVGASLYSGGQPGEGRVSIFLGSQTGMDQAPLWSYESNQSNAQLGKCVAGAGDFNGDGYSDFVAGSPQYSNGQSSEGRVFIFFGSATMPSVFGGYESDQAAAQFGSAVSSAGDVNGDGFSDVLVGAPYYTNGTAREGGAFLYLGFGGGALARTGFAPPSSAWSAESGQADAHLGWSVGSAGDVNGDGFADLLVGTPGYDDGQADEGRVEAYLANGLAGLDRIPQQRTVDDAAPIGLLGLSGSANAFRLRTLARTAAGRGRVRLEWEVKEAGVPFDGLGLGRTDAADTGAPTSRGSAVPLGAITYGWTIATPYHWRLRVSSDDPFFPRSPWVSVPGNGMTELDLRTDILPLADTETTEPAHPPTLLEAALPNPFHTSTEIAYALPVAARVRISIHDVLGREHRVLEEGARSAGRYLVHWDGRSQTGERLQAGIYFVRLHAGDRTDAQKIVLTE